LIFNLLFIFKFENFVCYKLAKILRMKDFKVEPMKENKKLFTEITNLRMETLEKSSKKNAPIKNNDLSDNSIEKRIRKLEEFLNDSANEKSEEKLLEEKQLKSKFAAIVLDRFFLVLSILYTIVTFAGIIMSVSNFYKGN
jgi:hypothetical protein